MFDIQASHTEIAEVARSIIVRFQRPGFHCYPDAPDEVAYLRSVHRHVFHFELELPVSHNDRELEFHMVLKRASAWIGELFELGPCSCEHAAQSLAGWAIEQYGLGWAECLVWEDGECGARVRITKSARSR